MNSILEFINNRNIIRQNIKDSSLAITKANLEAALNRRLAVTSARTFSEEQALMQKSLAASASVTALEEDIKLLKEMDVPLNQFKKVTLERHSIVLEQVGCGRHLTKEAAYSAAEVAFVLEDRLVIQEVGDGEVINYYYSCKKVNLT